MRRWDPLNHLQMAVLRRLAAGDDLSGLDEAHARVSARALIRRGLAEVRRREDRSYTVITAAGMFYLEHGHHPERPPDERHRAKPIQPERSVSGLAKPQVAPIDWDGEPYEHEGMLWKPEPGTSVTFDQFVQARLLVVEIHRDTAWNRWRQDERAQELSDAMDVFGQWRRAEPDFRPKTDDEFAVWMADGEAKFPGSHPGGRAATSGAYTAVRREAGAGAAIAVGAGGSLTLIVQGTGSWMVRCSPRWMLSAGKRRSQARKRRSSRDSLGSTSFARWSVTRKPS